LTIELRGRPAPAVFVAAMPAVKVWTSCNGWAVKFDLFGAARKNVEQRAEL
jgi:hypothetical protein